MIIPVLSVTVSQNPPGSDAGMEAHIRKTVEWQNMILENELELRLTRLADMTRTLKVPCLTWKDFYRVLPLAQNKTVLKEYGKNIL